MVKIKVKLGDIIEEKADAIVNPTNTYGIMSASVSKVIKRIGGAIIEAESIRSAPIPMGSAMLTDAGMLHFKHIIHAPTIERPGLSASEESIRKAVFASLVAAEDNRLSVIAMPGMGTGIGGFEPIDAAKAIIDEIRNFKASNLKEVILVDISEIVVMALHSALKEQR